MVEYELDLPGVFVKINVSTKAKVKDDGQDENLPCTQSCGCNKNCACVSDLVEKLTVFLAKTLIEHNFRSHDETPTKSLLHIWKYYGGKTKTFRKAIRILTS